MPIFFILLLLVLLLLLVSPLIVGIVLLARKHLKTGIVVLGLYAALIGFFLIHGQIEKRSASGHVLRWIKGENGMHQKVNDLAEDVKKVVNPSELQQWAVNVLQETRDTNSWSEIPRDKVPASIRNLTNDASPSEDASCDAGSAQNASVWLVWGGGFGHWGMRVGSPTFKIVPKPDDNYYIEWKPGVYFWCETH